MRGNMGPSMTEHVHQGDWVLSWGLQVRGQVVPLNMHWQQLCVHVGQGSVSM